MQNNCVAQFIMFIVISQRVPDLSTPEQIRDALRKLRAHNILSAHEWWDDRGFARRGTRQYVHDLHAWFSFCMARLIEKQQQQQKCLNFWFIS